MQVAYKNATAGAFHSVEKKQTFFKRVDGLCLYAISRIRQPVAQELDKIHVLYVRKFCKSTSGVRVSKLPPSGQIRPRKSFQPAREGFLTLIQNNILRNVC